MRAAIYLSVSTNGQTTDMQERELRAAAERIPAIHPARRAAIRAAYKVGGVGLRAVAAQFGVSVETVRRCVG